MEHKCTLSDIEELFELIKETLKIYKNSKIQDKRFTLFLANGEEIKYEIPYETVPHILGIKTDFFSSNNFFGVKKSSEVLEKMLETPYKVYNQIKKNPEKVISKHISKKLDNFNDLLYLNLDNILFVCAYDVQRTYGFKEQSECVDYIVVSQRQDGKYSILNLVKNDNGICYIRSNRLYEDSQELEKDLEEYLPNQNITLATGCKVYDKKIEQSSKPYWLYIPKKEKKSKEIYKYAKKYGATIDVFSDYYKAISAIHSDFEDQKVDTEIIDEVIKSAKNKEIIAKDIYATGDIDNQTLSLIEVINDLIFNLPSNKAGVKYSDLDAEIKSLKEKNETLIEENTILSSENESLTEKIEKIEEMNGLLEEKIDGIKKILC